MLIDTNPNEPVRLFIYGDGGLGKSTLIARSDRPVIVAVENGASRLTDAQGKPIKMWAGIKEWKDLLDAIKWLTDQPHDFKTVGLDSATEIERLAHAEILKGQPGKSIITVDKGYGAGDKRSGTMHKELIVLVENLRAKRGVNIIVTGHQKVKQAKDPAMSADYDAFEPKFQTAEPLGIWKEYVDATLFVRLRTFLKTSEESTARAMTDGVRVVYTSQEPAFYAKNRFGLPHEMEFTLDFWNEFKKFADKGLQPISATEIMADIDLLKTKVTEEKLMKKINQSIIDAGDNVTTLTNIRTRLMQVTGVQNGL